MFKRNIIYFIHLATWNSLSELRKCDTGTERDFKRYRDLTGLEPKCSYFNGTY